MWIAQTISGQGIIKPDTCYVYCFLNSWFFAPSERPRRPHLTFLWLFEVNARKQKKLPKTMVFKSLDSLIVSGQRRIGSRIVLPGRLESKAKTRREARKRWVYGFLLWIHIILLQGFSNARWPRRWPSFTKTIQFVRKLSGQLYTWWDNPVWRVPTTKKSCKNNCEVWLPM